MNNQPDKQVPYERLKAIEELQKRWVKKRRGKKRNIWMNQKILLQGFPFYTGNLQIRNRTIIREIRLSGNSYLPIKKAEIKRFLCK